MRSRADIDEPPALGKENKSQGIRSGVDCQQRIVHRGEAANLDANAAFAGRVVSEHGHLLSLARFDNAAGHRFHWVVVRQHMHSPIAPSKKRAQNPTDDTDDDRSPESAAKALDMKAIHDPRNEKEHESIDDEDKKAKGEENQ